MRCVHHCQICMNMGIVNVLRRMNTYAHYKLCDSWYIATLNTRLNYITFIRKSVFFLVFYCLSVFYMFYIYPIKWYLADRKPETFIHGIHFLVWKIWIVLLPKPELVYSNRFFTKKAKTYDFFCIFYMQSVLYVHYTPHNIWNNIKILFFHLLWHNAQLYKSTAPTNPTI